MSRSDDYDSSHPHGMEVTVVQVDSRSGELDEESIATVQFSRIKLGGSARDKCGGGGVGGFVMVLPLDKGSCFDRNVR